MTGWYPDLTTLFDFSYPIQGNNGPILCNVVHIGAVLPAIMNLARTGLRECLTKVTQKININLENSASVLQPEPMANESPTPDLSQTNHRVFAKPTLLIYCT